MREVRTIVSAADPYRIADDCRVYLKVWFEEFDGPLPFVADPFDCERHGKELWIRAMAGEFGPVTVIEPPPAIEVQPLRMIAHDVR